MSSLSAILTSIDIAKQIRGTCFVYSIARCLERLLRSLKASKGRETFLDITTFLMDYHGTNGEIVLSAAQHLISEDNEATKTFIPDDLRGLLRVKESKQEEDIKAILRRGGRLVVTIDIFESQMDAFQNSDVIDFLPEKKNGDKLSNHAVVLTHWNDEGVMTFKNSWGPDSGDAGCFRVKNVNVLLDVSEDSRVFFYAFYISDESQLSKDRLEVLQIYRKFPLEHYEFLDTCGTGQVFKVRDRDTRKVVCLKKLKHDLCEEFHNQESGKEIALFLRGDFPVNRNVLRFEKEFHFYGDQYIVTEFISGCSLTRIVQRDVDGFKGALVDMSKVEEWSRQIFLGLEALHHNATVIIHRDLHPGNILVQYEPGSKELSTKPGSVKIIDFGMSLAQHDHDAHSHSVTGEVGIIQYFSPERLRLDPFYNEKDDLWAAACIITEMVTGVGVVTVTGAGVQKGAPVASFSREMKDSKLKAVEEKSEKLGQVCRALLDKMDHSSRPSATQVLEDFFRDAPDNVGRRLYEAASEWKREKVEKTCKKWKHNMEVLNWVNPEDDGQTPLHAAYANSQITAILVSTPGCEVNKGDENGETPLFYAAYYGEPETVQALLAAPGIDLNKAPTEGRHKGKRPLTIARESADGDYNEVVHRLLKKNYNEVVELLEGAETKAAESLWQKASNGTEQQVSSLCEQWSGNKEVLNWASPEDDGQTPLHAAYASSQITAILVSTPGCDVNKGDENGETPLFYAAFFGNSETAKALLAAPGIDINKTPTRGDYEDKSPLTIAQEGAVSGRRRRESEKEAAARREGCQEVVKLLASKMLWEAAIDGNVHNVEALCGDFRGNREVLSWANPDEDGSTPLHAACYTQYTAITAILLSTPGCEVNKGDKYGCTPLWGAAFFGKPETVQALLAAPGIDLNKAPTGGMYIGKSPLTIARENPLGKEECQGVVRLLETEAFEDQTLECQDCKEPFTFSAEKQEFFAEKGFTSEPLRCDACQRAKKERFNNNSSDRGGGYGGRGLGCRFIHESRGGGGSWKGGGRGGYGGDQSDLLQPPPYQLPLLLPPPLYQQVPQQQHQHHHHHQPPPPHHHHHQQQQQQYQHQYQHPQTDY